LYLCEDAAEVAGAVIEATVVVIAVAEETEVGLAAGSVVANGEDTVVDLTANGGAVTASLGDEEAVDADVASTKPGVPLRLLLLHRRGAGVVDMKVVTK